MVAEAKWRTLDCPCCGGHGVVSVYTYGGDDFLGADDCGDCGGSGRLFILPSGHIAMYPGGPMRGMWSKEAYMEAETPDA